MTRSLLRTYAARTIGLVGGLAITAASFVAGATDLATVETAVTGALSGLATALSGLITEGLVYSRSSYEEATESVPPAVLEAVETAAIRAAEATVERYSRP